MLWKLQIPQWWKIVIVMPDLRGMRKILSKAVTGDAIDGTAKGMSTFLRRAPLVAGAIIAGTGVIDYGTNKIQEVNEERRAKNEQKEEVKAAKRGSWEKDMAYSSMEEFSGFMQELWDERSKHSRAWGGKIY